MRQLPDPLRVVVAEDDEKFRRALCEVLGADPRFEVVGEAERGDGLAALVAEHDAHLVVLDVRMPHGGVDAVTDLDRSRSARGTEWPRICALSAQTGTTTVTAMMRAGATGFLAKGSVGSDLGDLLVRCAQGEVVLGVPGAAEVIDQLGPSFEA